MPIRCDIVSQDRIVFSGDADLILLPGVEGVMGVLPDHSNLLTVLQFGVITVRTARDEQYFTVAGGVAEIQPDHVTVMADAAENVLEIDIERAEAAKKRAEETLAQGLPADSDVYLTQMAALRRSTMRLDAARRYKSRKSRQD
ncbi:MAG TPA: ATP synthase F1 subunit epsilon [Anaerolineaceae bacterium]|jgi:F-type H+-transporting ATPase subunit epsilon|nr:ATP synthase F1 subunit epsilon [Longilinea sp.]HNS64475.1 ATP synthase F1 subunit epsilon [Anaerolineaceae bacterium]HNZ01613.1 ATP synthase F1 subunit epsilon [Anaerolineaceae bacterium]HOD45372.1 ATP synthase F1 subunit epsilon [Anaerolineaceae bacterium]HOH20744.1 ATP synthase F1 subunit epsilon [Anaerolineaceae bacterium]